jgi:hypothetical protein
MTFQSIGQAAAKVVDPWEWYFAALKDPSAIGKTLLAAESDPQQGYYRARFKDSQWEPVAIFYPEGSDQLVGYRNGREVRDVNALWVSCLRHPISYAAYEKAIAGGGFDDEPPAPVGHNSGDADPFDALRLELAGEAEQADEFLKSEVKTQADADKAGIWAKRLSEIAKRADAEREREKAPHLQACRDVDDKWRPVVGDAKDKAAALKRHVEPFLIAQKRAAEEAARKAREEAERQRRAAQEAQDEQQRAAALAAAQEAERAAEVKNASAGRTGARVSVRTEKVGVVTDYAKAAVALVAMKHKDMIAVIDQLAQRAAKSGMAFDGMEIKEQERVV